MKQTSNKPFHSCDDLVGFFQINRSKNRNLMVLEKTQDLSKSTLTVFSLAGTKPTKIKEITNAATAIGAIDAVLDEKGTLICNELNSYHALQWVRADSSKLFGPEKKPVFELIAEGGITDSDAAKVNLSTTDLWNSLVLDPKKWLFNPSFVRGVKSANKLVANSSDGQVVLLDRVDDGTISSTFVNAHGIQPKACLTKTGIGYAFLHDDHPISPFWRRNQMPKVASLEVSEGGKTVDLSISLGISGILGHTLSPDIDDAPWLFALQEAPVGTNIIAISRSASSWIVRGKQNLVGEVWRLSAAHDGQVWRIIIAENRSDKWELKDFTWQI